MVGGGRGEGGVEVEEEEEEEEKEEAESGYQHAFRYPERQQSEILEAAHPLPSCSSGTHLRNLSGEAV
jgi:hypothetical protein